VVLTVDADRHVAVGTGFGGRDDPAAVPVATEGGNLGFASEGMRRATLLLASATGVVSIGDRIGVGGVASWREECGYLGLLDESAGAEVPWVAADTLDGAVEAVFVRALAVALGHCGR
jgi:hypothetical protein